MVERSDETGLPYALTAVLYEGPLAQLLRLLLAETSLQEICARDALYCALYRLLQSLGTADHGSHVHVPVSWHWAGPCQ